MRKIIYTRPDGCVSVVTPVINTYPVRESITEAQAEQRAFDKLPADAINPQFVEASAIPDRSTRKFWKLENGAITVDTAKASRAAILKQLAELDVKAGSVRWVRELALGTNTILEALRTTTHPQLPAPGTGMTKVQAVEDQANALRAQLAAL
jgi:hypothetical protein